RGARTRPSGGGRGRPGVARPPQPGRRRPSALVRLGDRRHGRRAPGRRRPRGHADRPAPPRRPARSGAHRPARRADGRRRFDDGERRVVRAGHHARGLHGLGRRACRVARRSARARQRGAAAAARVRAVDRRGRRLGERDRRRVVARGERVIAQRLLAGIDGGPAWSAHLERFGPLPDAADLADLAERASLRGRGGAAFAVAAKLRSVAGRGGAPVVVGNGVEGEPASGKDKVLLRYTPHLVLDGAVAAARYLGARTAVVAVARSARSEQAVLARAVAERRGDGVALELATVPDGFVSGEETALLQALGGGPARPTTKPPYPFERGLRGAPTLVQNVETLAHLALVVRNGPAWFRSVGTAEAPGTALVTLSGAVGQTGVYEIPFGT